MSLIARLRPTNPRKVEEELRDLRSRAAHLDEEARERQRALEDRRRRVHLLETEQNVILRQSRRHR